MASPRTLDALFTMIEDRLRRETLDTIHKDVDLEKLKALDEWWDKQGLSYTSVLSITAFFLAHTLYEASDSENEGCAGSQAYSDYIHSATHRLFLEYPKDGISSDPPPPRPKRH